MPEKDTIFSSKVKHAGIFSFKDFYKFCYDWLTEETGLEIMEDRYEEKIAGETKTIVIDWTGTRQITDYFGFEMKVSFIIGGLKNIELNQSGTKIKTNEGSVTVNVKSILVRDYEAKFESTASKKFMRSVYEKWVIPSRIQEFEGKVAGDSDEFLGQIKAYLDLEGKK